MNRSKEQILPEATPGGMSAEALIGLARSRGFSPTLDSGPDGELAVVVEGDVGLGARRAAARLVDDKLIEWVVQGASMDALEARLGSPRWAAEHNKMWYLDESGVLVLAERLAHEDGWTVEWRYTQAMVAAGILTQAELDEHLKAMPGGPGAAP